MVNALTGASGALFNNASATACPTATLSWNTGDVVVLLGGTEGGTGGETFGTPSNTGTGIAWGAAQKIHDSTGTDAGVACWAAVATGASSGTFSIAPTHASGTREKLVAGLVISGSGGIGNSVLYNGVSPTGASLTPTAANGSIVWITMDWFTAAVTGNSPTSTSHGASAPGPTALPWNVQTSPQFTSYVAVLDTQASSGAVSYGITGTGVGPFSIIALEVKAGGAQNLTVPVDDNRGLVDTLDVAYTPGPGMMVWTTNVGIG